MVDYAAQLAKVVEAIDKIQEGGFESRIGERYFQVPHLSELRRERRRLEILVRRAKAGSVYRGLARGG